MAKVSAALEEFDLRIKQIKHHNEETSRTVFTAAVLEWRPKRKEWQETNQVITCIGNFYGIVENDHLHVKAEEFEDRIYGTEWQIYLSERVQPGTELEMKKFLMSVQGVGARNAEKIVEEFGIDAISEILRDPSSLNRLGIPKPAKEGLYQAIVENQSFEQLLLFLQLHDVEPKYTTQIYKKYGSNAIEKIQDNPYSLYLDDVIKFQTADVVNQSLGGNTYRGYRTTAGILACLRDEAERNGNVFVARESMLTLLKQFLSRSTPLFSNEDITEDEVEDGICSLVNTNRVIVDGRIADTQSIYLKHNYYAEQAVSNRLYELMTNIKRFYASKEDIQAALEEVQKETHFHLAPEQACAVGTGLSSPVSILTGGPGTGKTQTLTMLIKTAKKLNPAADIRICAPTGKAAVRAQELTNMPAATIHRTVGFPHKMLEENELVCDILIADEFSMCDITLCSWLMKCLDTGARLVIVGDHEQLPSVGPGLVLRDLIDSGCVPVTKLETVFRQASHSRIISNAHAIIKSNRSQEIKLSYSMYPGSDFYFIESFAQSKILRTIQKSVKRLMDEGFPINQIEVLSPIHGSLIGSDNLNIVLQDMLNPGSHGYHLSRNLDLREGDKVIQTKNDYDLSVFNGETGVVKSINYSPARALLVEYPNREVWYDSEQVENLDLAYAITTHRSQGSEFQAVIIPIHETILYNVNKNLLYTAITRAKKRVILVGSKSAFQMGLKKEGAMQRNSNLIVRLQSSFLAP